MFGSVLILSRFTRSILIMDRVLGDGVLRLKGRYPAGTASKVGFGATDTPLGEGTVLGDDDGIGVGV